MGKEVLCMTCLCWINCMGKNKEPHGFCLCEPLFTYTARTQCKDYIKGTPSTDEEWEDFQKCRNT